MDHATKMYFLFIVQIIILYSIKQQSQNKINNKKLAFKFSFKPLSVEEISCLTQSIRIIFSITTAITKQRSKSACFGLIIEVKQSFLFHIQNS